MAEESSASQSVWMGQEEVAATPTPVRRGTRRWIAAFVLLASIPLGYRFVKHEMSQWYLAAAAEAELEDDLPVAAQYVERALAWSPSNAMALEQKVQISFRRGNAVDTLPTCDLLLSLMRHQAESSSGSWGAIATQQLASALNTSAYAHALANKDIDKALAQIEEAAELLGDQMALAVRDTRAYIYFLKGRYAEALQDADIVLREFEELEYPAMRKELLKLTQVTTDKRKIERESRLVRDMHAVYCQHRGLIHQALGNDEQAAADLARAKELGFDPAQGVW